MDISTKPPARNTAKRKATLFSTRNIIFVLAGLLVAAIGTSVYFYMKIHADPQQEAKKDLERTIALVSKHMVLPETEVPTLATVSDPEKLRDQPFFANAKTGDKVLIYSSFHKAILYSPSQDRIVEVAPINISGNQAQ